MEAPHGDPRTGGSYARRYGQAACRLERVVSNNARRMDGSYKRRQRDIVLRRDGPKCHHCGVLTVPSTGNADQRLHVRTVDHLVPFARGGSNSVKNLVIACRACNQAKADCLPREVAL